MNLVNIIPFANGSKNYEIEWLTWPWVYTNIYTKRVHGDKTLNISAEKRENIFGISINTQLVVVDGVVRKILPRTWIRLSYMNNNQNIIARVIPHPVPGAVMEIVSRL